jgi:hypothetical protein
MVWWLIGAAFVLFVGSGVLVSLRPDLSNAALWMGRASGVVLAAAALSVATSGPWPPSALEMTPEQVQQGGRRAGLALFAMNAVLWLGPLGTAAVLAAAGLYIIWECRP